jgi:ABC-type uncharacterized transport system permease subunit
MAQEVLDQDLLDYESRNQPLAPIQRYIWRLVLSMAIAALLIAASLGLGVVGYAYFERMGWLDAFLNASMILSGMGPVDTVKTEAGKLFAGCYAIYSGFVVLLAAGFAFAPVVHRILHRFHVDEAGEGD